MKIVKTDEDQALLWSLAYGIAYAVCLNRYSMPALPASAVIVDEAARRHADRVVKTLVEKGEELKGKR